MIVFKKVRDRLDKADAATNWYYHPMKHFITDKLPTFYQ